MATAAAVAARWRAKEVGRRSAKYVDEALYRKLFKGGTGDHAVGSELNSFLKSRKRAFKWEVGVSVRRLRRHGLPNRALKLAETMTKRGMNPTVSDQAIHLDLVAKSRGIESAEEYFRKLPESSKNHLTYGSLLNCYCKELMTEKAEALMLKMKELKFATTAMSYNSLMTLYTKTKQPEKVPAIIQEMKAAEVMPDCYTYNVWMRALAAVDDISGVERVIEEMKRDGRVAADWTTFSNLASIYVDAGLFQKAEIALKELEKRNTDEDITAYQFLITLYGRTQNLIEVHRLWRRLRLAHPKMVSMSYLNMIQVLGNLKDLSGAAACFKEWEAKRTVYDVRVANAMMGAYLKENMLAEALSVRHRAVASGGKLNAKSWKIFMDYYLCEGNFITAHNCAEKAIKKGLRNGGKTFVPSQDVIHALMQHFESTKNTVDAEKFLEVLMKVKKDVGARVYEALVRTYAAAGQKCQGMRQRLKMADVTVSEETSKLLDAVC